MSYLGSSLHEFWSKCGDNHIHPEDQPFFTQDDENKVTKLATAYQTKNYGPWPFDGPLDKALVVICYANPLFSINDIQYEKLIKAQRSGIEELPRQWDEYYQPRIGTALKLPMEKLRQHISIFNVCPYPSISMEGPAVRFASGLPSVWAAQKHLREVLIPKAMNEQIFLVLARKHQLWGVIEGFKSDNIAFSRNRSGTLGQNLGGRIREWLGPKTKHFE